MGLFYSSSEVLSGLISYFPNFGCWNRINCPSLLVNIQTKAFADTSVVASHDLVGPENQQESSGYRTSPDLVISIIIGVIICGLNTFYSGPSLPNMLTWVTENMGI